jgi:two-component system sensor histidine kinase KdpD
LIRGAAALARSVGAELVGVHVRAPGRLSNPTSTAEHRRLLRELGGTYQEVDGESVPAALRCLARGGGTQLVLGSTRRPRWREMVSRSVLDAVTRDADFDVHVIPPLIDAGRRSTETRGPHPTVLRRRGAWALAAGSVPLLTLALAATRSEGNLSTSLLLFVLLTVAVAALGGAPPALFVAVTGFLAVNWFLTPPFHTLVVARAANLTALVTFLVVGAVVSFLVAQVSRRSVEAARARADAETLTRAAREIAAAPEPVSTLLLELVRTFDLDGASVMRPDGAGWEAVDSVGPHPPKAPAEATMTIPLVEPAILAITGSEVGASERPVLQAIADQVTMALEQRRLRRSRTSSRRSTRRPIASTGRSATSSTWGASRPRPFRWTRARWRSRRSCSRRSPA